MRAGLDRTPGIGPGGKAAPAVGAVIYLRS
jgi:hypothetical protein